MLILFDHVTPKGIARALPGHTVSKAKDRGWDTLSNGDLLAAGEQAGFDVLVTADKNMRYQQNLRGRRIGIVVLNSLFLKMASIAALAPQVQSALDGGLAPGAFLIIDPPF